MRVATYVVALLNIGLIAPNRNFARAPRLIALLRIF